MRKYLFLLILGMIGAGTVSAQGKPKYKAFTFDFGAGALTHFSGTGGSLAYLEPGYTFFNRIKASLRVENSKEEAKKILSSMIILDYNQPIPGTGIRLFAGGGVGTYNVSLADGSMMFGCGGGPGTVTTRRETAHSSSMLRAGIKVSHFNLAINYHFVPTTHVYDMDASQKTIGIKDHENAYYGISVGVSIGGGRRRAISN